jgi:hypothetical protein
MAALLSSWGGLSVLLLDERVGGARAIGWALLTIAGLGAGCWCRGAVFGLAVPLVSVGATAWLTRGASPLGPAAAPRRALALAALAALAGGAAAIGAGAYALARATPLRFSYALGAAAFEGLRYPTFEQTWRLLGHGLFPWSAFLPAALALLSSTPSPPSPASSSPSPASSPSPPSPSTASLGREAERLRAARFRIALVLGAAASYAAHAWLAPTTGPLPFVGVGLLAAACALALDELRRRRGPRRTMALASAAFGALLAIDLRRLPDTTLAALAAPTAPLPVGFEGRAASLWLSCAAIGALPLWLALAPDWSVRGGPRGARALLGRFVRRDRLACAGLALAGLVPCLLLYPELSSRWSPDDVFASYRRRRGDGEPLGLLGVAARSPAYYGEPAARVFAEASEAIAWLDGAKAPARRWALVRAGDLPELNALWRARPSVGGVDGDRNLALLDVRSGYIFLAASSLREGERNATPLAPFVGDERPRPAHPLEARFGDELELLGWELYEGDDKTPAPTLVRGRAYVLHTYYRVVATPTLPWRAFVHLEGGAHRHTADHALEAYPMQFWQPGDIITDRSELRLEPNFATGVHSLYVGFYRGESRLPVAGGQGGDDRVEAGTLRVF